MVKAAATAAKVAMVARAKDSSPGSSSSTTWVEATVVSGRVVVAKVEEAIMVAVLSLRVAAMVVSGRVVAVVDTTNNRIDRAATEVAAKVAVGTTIKVAEEATREVVLAVAAVAVVVEDNLGIHPSSRPTL